MKTGSSTEERFAGAGFKAMLTIADLYVEFESGLSRYAGSLARDTDRANDLVSETFLQAMAHLPLLEQLNTYQRKSWLYRVLKNRFIDQRRADKRAQTMVEQPGLDERNGHPGRPGAGCARPGARPVPPGAPPALRFRNDQRRNRPQARRPGCHRALTYPVGHQMAACSLI